MLIEQVILENFRQYQGKQTITFSTDPEKNVTIVHGVNGAGKTSLFLALNWCLYGSEEAGVPGEIPSKSLAVSLPDGQRIGVAVEIRFRHEGIKYSARRFMGFRKMRKSLTPELGSEEFSLVKISGSGEAKEVGNPTLTINSILPSTARTYFLFDGEKIDSFAKPGSAWEIRAAVEQVIGLEALKRGAEHLESTAKRLRAELKTGAGAELVEFLKQEEARDLELEQLANDLARHRDEKKKAEEARKVIDEKLAGFSKVKELIQRRADLDARRIKCERDEERLHDQARDEVNRGSLILAGGAIETAAAFLEEKRRKGEIPSSIRQQFIQDLIERHRCICQREILPGSEEERALTLLMRQSMPGSLEDDVLRTTADLRVIQQRGASFVERVRELQRRRGEIRDEIAETQKRLDEISNQVKAVTEEDIQKLEKSRLEIVTKIEDMGIEVKHAEAAMVTTQGELTRLRKQIVDAKAADERNAKMQRKVELAWQAVEAIKKLHEEYSEEKRVEIEAVCKDLFKKMVWKESQFQDVQLTRDYELDVTDRFGTPARPDLSAGERELLSLSFIAAMAKCSGSEAPFVIDTPFGRISEEPRENIAKFLPGMCRQLVLFVTDVELTAGAAEEFKKRTGAEYTLAFDDSRGVTDIEEGYHAR